MTLAAGLFRGLEREAAARFAFLMGIPIIAGAGLWKTRSIVTGGGGARWTSRCSPPASSRRPSPDVLAISLLLRYLRTHSLAIFIAYRLIAAVVFVVLTLATR